MNTSNHLNTFVTPDEMQRIRNAVHWLNSTAGPHVRRSLTRGERGEVTKAGLMYHGLMQIVESCEEMKQSRIDLKNELDAD